MEQVEPVPLPYEPRPRPKPLLKKKELRQSNRLRFDVMLVSVAQFVLYVVISLWDARMRQPRLVVVFSTLWMLQGVVQLHDILRRYRLAARQWMARRGERRILKYGVVLRVLGVSLRRPAPFIHVASDSGPAAQSPEGTARAPAIPVDSSDGQPINQMRKRHVSRATPSTVSQGLQQLFGLGMLTIACIAFFAGFHATQHPVASAFGLLFIAIFVVGALSMAANLGASCWRGCSAAGRSHISQSWIDYWKSRVESFEMPQKSAGA